MAPLLLLCVFFLLMVVMLSCCVSSDRLFKCCVLSDHTCQVCCVLSGNLFRWFSIVSTDKYGRWFSTDEHFEFSVFFNGLFEVSLVDDSSMVSSEFVNDVGE